MKKKQDGSKQILTNHIYSIIILLDSVPFFSFFLSFLFFSFKVTTPTKKKILSTKSTHKKN